MELKNLLEFIEIEDERIKKYFDENHSLESEIVLARMVKLTEEIGELGSEVLAFNDDQKKEKLDKKGKYDLSNEFADVIITTLLLAKSMNVNIQKALIRKIEKINKGYVD